jgi:hypothetical protein
LDTKYDADMTGSSRAAISALPHRQNPVIEFGLTIGKPGHGNPKVLRTGVQAKPVRFQNE